VVLSVHVVGPWVPPVVGPAVLAMCCACVAGRWLLPLLLRWLGKLVDAVIGVVGAVLVLPEFWVSARRTRPSPFAYDYGDAVAAAVRFVHVVVAFVLGRTADGARSVPYPLLALAGGVLYFWI
jgi:hypothetical protein